MNQFLAEYGWTILFYATLILLIYLFRHKLQWQGIAGLYRTKVGLKLMERMGRHERFFKAFGYAAVVAGFLGMAFIVGMLVKGLYDLVFVPGAPPVVSPVLPGVPIPGAGVTVPLIIGWVALFVVIVIHEFSHGVVARAHKVPVTSSGLMLFGPIAGAFVEPDEKVLAKKSRGAKLSVYAAGPFSNIVTAGLTVLVLTFVLAPLTIGFIANNGVVFDSVQEGYPAAAAGIRTGVVYDYVDGVQVNTSDQFLLALEGLDPGDTVILESTQAGVATSVVTVAHPENASRAYLGVIQGVNLVDPADAWLFDALLVLIRICTWVFILSLGIGLANLLPLGPVDGGRMFQLVAVGWFGEKAGTVIWKKLSLVVILVLIVLLFVPIGRSIFA